MTSTNQSGSMWCCDCRPCLAVRRWTLSAERLIIKQTVPGAKNAIRSAEMHIFQSVPKEHKWTTIVKQLFRTIPFLGLANDVGKKPYLLSGRLIWCISDYLLFFKWWALQLRFPNLANGFVSNANLNCILRVYNDSVLIFKLACKLVCIKKKWWHEGTVYLIID